MILSGNSLTKEDRLFLLVNDHPDYSAVWAEQNPEAAEKLIEDIRKTHWLEWVPYRILFTQAEIDKIMESLPDQNS